ncbi:GNAT family N-acetyltransferase [Pasteurella multocida]|uniref:GNAT family N-acetyltransferase n=1 Tax=Pasteurella multocida TaxID=747 RepID=UPI00397C8ACB
MKFTSVKMINGDQHYQICQQELKKHKWKDFDYGSLGEQDVRYAILNENNELIGFYQLIEYQENYEKQASCELYKLFIFPEYRGQGYGSLIVKELMQYIYLEYNEFYIEILDETKEFWDKALRNFICANYTTTLSNRVQNGIRYIFSKKAKVPLLD